MQGPKYLKLDSLMREFHIDGRHLAKLMNVDDSLVSKWRNGKRAIGKHYIRNLSGILIALDRTNRFARLMRMTGYQALGSAQADEQTLRAYFETWLQSDEPEAPADDLRSMIAGRAKASEIYVFHGTEGKRDAVGVFLDYALEDTNQKIWLFSQEDPDWLSADPAYMEAWQQKNEWIIQRNNTIQVIHPVSKNHKQVADYIIRWIPILMKRSATAYYIPRYQDPQCQVAIYLIENKVALISLFVQGRTQKRQTYLITDIEILKNIKDVLLDQFRASREMFHMMEYAGHPVLQRRIIANIKSCEPMACLVGDVPPFLVREDIWIACIANATMQAKEKERCCTLARSICYEHCRRENEYGDVCCVFHTQHIDHALTQERVVLSAFSRLAGFPVIVNRADYTRLLLSAADIAAADGHIKAVALTEAPPEFDECIDVYTWRTGGTCLLCTEDEEDQRGITLYTEEVTVSLALYYRCMALFQSAMEEQERKPSFEQWVRSIVETKAKQ